MTKSNKIPRVPSNDVSKFAPGFMLQMDFSFFNVVSIHGFTSNFVAICSDNSYPFGFPSIRKHLTLETLKFLVATLGNMDNKVSFIRVDEDGELSRSYEFIKICDKMNITLQTTGGDAF